MGISLQESGLERSRCQRYAADTVGGQGQGSEGMAIMKMTVAIRVSALVGLGFLAASCAQTTPAPSLMSSLAPTLDADASLAPPQAAGYLFSGESFAGDLQFVETDGQARALYAHAVDGAPTLNVELRPDPNWLSDGVRRFEGVSDRGMPISVEMEAGACRTGGQGYGRFVSVQAGTLTYEGCAQETGPYVSWSEGLARHLPKVEACMLASQTSSMAFVRGAGRVQVLHVEEASDSTIVRMRFGESGRWDCTLNEQRASWRIVGDTAPVRMTEADPVFILGEMPAAGEACYVYERVRNAEGEDVGALGYDACLAGPVAMLEPGSR